MFEEYMQEPEIADILFKVAYLQQEVEKIPDEDLVNLVQRMDPKIQLPAQTEEALEEFFFTGALSAYRDFMEQIYVLYKAPLGYNDNGQVCEQVVK